MSGKRRKTNATFSLTNLKRCIYSATLSMAVFPLILLLTVIMPEQIETYQIPGTFFAVISMAFAYLLYQVKKQKAKKYYEGVMWAYLLFVQLYLTYFAQQSLVFYYTSVLLLGVLVYIPLGQYVVLVLGQLVCYVGIMVKSGIIQVAVPQILLLIFVHLLAFWLSREFYALKCEYVAVEKKLRKEIWQSEHDMLTGLLNQKGLERNIQSLWKECCEHQELVAVLVIEIDYFKSYNDRFGKAQGDSCICKIAQNIMETAKSYGCTIRSGGAEFLVFIHELNVQEIYELAEQIRCNVEELGILRGNGTNQSMTVSIGVDIRYASEDITFKGLCGRAGLQLQQAKQEGRNCVSGYHDTREVHSRIS